MGDDSFVVSHPIGRFVLHEDGVIVGDASDVGERTPQSAANLERPNPARLGYFGGAGCALRFLSDWCLQSELVSLDPAQPARPAMPW
jgi:hypothetical protein